MKLIIDGHKVEVSTELLAKAIANANQAFADWKSFTGKAEAVARELPKIIKIEWRRSKTRNLPAPLST